MDAALPALADSLHATRTGTQWVASSYLLTLAATVPLSAWSVRRLGARRLWLLCLALFATFSVWCALSTTLPMLLVGRVLQGAAGGLLVPAGQTMLAIVTGKTRMGRVLSTIGIGVVIAPALGTTVGGLMIGHLEWPWLFWLNLPLAGIALVAGFRCLPHQESAPSGGPDWLGLLLVVSGLVLFSYGLTALGDAGSLGSARADICTATGLLLLCLFVGYAWHHRAPALQLRLFTTPMFAAASAASFFGGVVNFGAQVILPLYFVQARGESTLVAGLLIGTQIIGTAIGFPLAGRLTDRYGGGRLLLAGGLITASATLPLALAGTGDTYLWLCAVLLVRGFGVALGTIPAMTVVMSSVDRDQLADAAPINNMLQRAGAAIGTALIAVLYAGHLTDATPSAAAHAFAYANGWLVAGAVLLAVPAWVLSRIERRHRATEDQS